MGWASSYFGVSLQIPATWLKVKRPLSKYRTLSDDAYFANETVSTPIALDSKGVWLTVRFHGLQACSLPDWRYATAKTTLTTQGGATDFFFEDPPPRDGPQPFAGYGVRGCTSLFDRNMEFMFTGVTKDSFEDNLGAFFQMMQSASFVQPGPRTVDAP
jgi:hypothetical protein